MAFNVPEPCRITAGVMASTPAYGNNGYFKISLGDREWNVVASDGEGWEHVSVSRPDQAPTWAVMCAIKALFWSEDDCVIQYHPAASEYVNFHPNCLHLWRPIGIVLPIPPSYMVGPKI